ncbi:MAG: tetratricopeptide repeat protein [Paracoccaceae bacterium]
MLRRIALVLTLVALPLAAPAQDRAQSLADIKAELVVLMAEFNALKAELVTTGGAASGAAGGDALQRLDAIEAALVRLTANAEEMELKLNRVVADGTNRIGDIEFRLCELTEGCDIATLPQIAVLGGDPVAAPEPLAGGEAAAPGVELALGEQADFDRARQVLEVGDFAAAAALFGAYAAAYPGGPLVQQALVLRGDALAQAGDIAGSARSYLDAFSGQPEGGFAAEALMKLGMALGALGQVTEACMTLAEVGTRFAGTEEAGEAAGAMSGLQCP